MAPTIKFRWECHDDATIVIGVPECVHDHEGDLLEWLLPITNGELVEAEEQPS